MSETRMIMPNRVKITVSDKVDQKFLSIGAEMDLPDGVDISVYADNMYNELSTILKKKIDAMPKPEAKPFSNGGAKKSYGGAKKGVENGLCTICQSPAKTSKKGNQYCSCWYED